MANMKEMLAEANAAVCVVNAPVATAMLGRPAFSSGRTLAVY